jgi:CHAT domain-containing protein/Tfp pilus assembly protein PilF
LLHAQTRLELHQPVVRELGPGKTDPFTVQLAAGQYAHVVARQKGVDVIVTVVDPAGKTVVTADSPGGMSGLEPASWIAAKAGVYKLNVSKAARTKETGKYEMELLEVHAPADADRTRIEAQAKLFAGAIQERLNTKESRPRALQLYEESLALWQKTHDGYEEYLCRFRTGSVHYNAGDYQKSLAAYEQALTLAQAIADPPSISNAQWGVANGRFALGEPKKAIDLYQEALATKRSIGDRFGETNLLSAIANLYFNQGDQKKAFEYLDQSLSVLRATGDKPGESAALFNLGQVAYRMGELQKALDCFEQALTLSRSTGDRSGQANALLGMGAVYAGRGEAPKALEYYQQALAVQHALGDRAAEAVTLGNMGNVYRDLGAEEKALDYYGQQMAVGQSDYSRAFAYMGMGDVYFFLGEKQKALDVYQKSLALERSLGDRSSEALALIGLGNVYTDLGGKQRPPNVATPEEKKKGLEDYEQALAVGRAANDFQVQVYALMGGGVAYSALGDKKKALEYFNMAGFFFGMGQFQQGVGWSKYEIARVERDLGNYAKARGLAAEVRELVESLRAKVVSPDLRASFFAAVNDCYGLEIDLLMRMHEADPSKSYETEALGISERVRARVLLESLGEARADIREGVDPKLLEQERTLQSEMNAKEMARIQMLAGGTPAMVQALEKEVRDLSARYDDVSTQIRAKSPHYAALNFPQPLDAAGIRKEVADGDTVLLEFQLGEERSFVWAVSPESVATAVLPKRSELEQASKSFRDALLDASAKESAAADAGKKLSHMLLGGVASTLGNKRLAVVADGALQYVPFAALPDPVSESQPLVVNHEIVSIPSASTMAVLRRENVDRKTSPNKLLAVLADPVFSTDDGRVGRARAAAKALGTAQNASLERSLNDLGIGGGRLFRLPGTRREAAGIVSLVPQEQRREALDFDASRSMMMSPEIGQYRIIHLATHGLLNSVHPELSGVVLSLVDRQGQPQDGFLRLNEIYNLKLGADLVVLSACQTALGKEVQGEGLVGLTRGFMYAGAPRVMASLWKVDDRATAELMKSFYGSMLGRDALRPAAALRAAQIKMWKTPEFASPYYWAAFTLQGEWR